MIMRRQLWFSCAAIAVLGCGGARGAVSPGARVPVAMTPTAGRTPGASAVAATPRPAPTVPSTEDPDRRAITELRHASALFETFVTKAGAEPRFADAVRRSKARMEDIQATLVFLEEGLRERNGR
jgi:hypothetical protein